jgi:glycosyltransferase involved in cell wall biosynthesis
MPPLLTVGIPVYNGMPWLPEMIESIRGQTYQDFAALVIDDGSSDGSAEYLRSIRDPRFRIVRQENRGITATLNRILAEVESPWMVRHDCDDVAFPQRLARTVDAITLFPDTGMLHSHAMHYQNGHRLGRLKTTVGDPVYLRRLAQRGYLPSICHSTVTLNVDKVRTLGGYRFDLNVEEYDMYWRMALTYDLRFIPETLVGYRMNGGSISARSMRAQAVNVLYIQYLLLSEIWDVAPRPMMR